MSIRVSNGNGGTRVKTFRAHRVSFEEFTGEKLGERQAGHQCCRTCCINPLHLKPEESQENLFQRDAHRRKEYEGAREFEPTNREDKLEWVGNFEQAFAA